MAQTAKLQRALRCYAASVLFRLCFAKMRHSNTAANEGGDGKCENKKCVHCGKAEGNDFCGIVCFPDNLWCDNSRKCRRRLGPGQGCDPSQSDTQCMKGGCRQANKCCDGTCTSGDCVAGDTCSVTGGPCQNINQTTGVGQCP